MTLRIDPSLGSTAQAPPPGRLGLAEAPVARAGPAGSVPFVLEGEQMAVTGTERRGEHTFWLGSRLVACGLTTDGGAGVNVVTAPATLRRELVGAGGSLLETTLAVPTLPLAAVQWAPVPGGRPPRGIQVALTLLPGHRNVRYHVHGEFLRAVPDGEAGSAMEIRVHPTPTEWSVREGADGGVDVRVSVAEGPIVTLLLAGGTAEAASRAVAAGAHLQAHEARAAAEADPATSETLTTATGVPDLDHAVAWAVARVRGGLARGAVTSPDIAFWSGLGALSVGDGVTAARAVETLRGHGPGEIPWLLGPPVPAEALATLLSARLTLLSGDPAPARQALLARGDLAARRAAADPEAWALWSLAVATLADALRFGAPDEEIAALREAAALPAGRRSALRLPMAGEAAPASPAGTLGWLLGGGRRGEHPTIRPVPGTPLEAWARCAGGDAEGGYAAWRAQVGSGLAGGHGGRGTWDTPSRPPGSAPGAGILLCGLAQGLLGLSPDAPSGRIRVAPALPRQVRAFEARGIRVGDARITLRYERDGRTHRFVLDPTRGRIPPMVLLEPSVPCAGLGGVRVDGATAGLDTGAESGRTRVRVQLHLDSVRTLDVDEAG